MGVQTDQYEQAMMTRLVARWGAVGFVVVVVLNGAASLLLMCFALGIIGSDVDAPDLSLPVLCFGIGVVAGGLALLAAACAYLRALRRRVWEASAQPGRCLLGLGGVGFVVALFAFFGGCLLATHLAFYASGNDGDATDTNNVSLVSPSTMTGHGHVGRHATLAGVRHWRNPAAGLSHRA